MHHWFPWWPTEASLGVAGKDDDTSYLVKTRLASGVGCALLVDTGSPDNLCSDEFSKELAAAAAAAERPAPIYRPMPPLAVGGIGKGIQTATSRVELPIGLGHDLEATYSAPELPNSSVPGLLGRKALREHRVLLDCFNNKFYTIGPGGYKLQLSPGSNVRDLEESPAGHLMLPCTRYPSAAGPAVETFAAEPGKEVPASVPASVSPDRFARDTSAGSDIRSSPSVSFADSTPKCVEPVLDVNLAHPSATTSSSKSTPTPKGSPQAGVPAMSS